jgi:RHS repeat-associated protein
VGTSGASGDLFATYSRDSGTGLDYADQRFYASSYGRFNSPDPFDGSATGQRPGSWNRYPYVEGDPINAVDPQGADLVYISGGAQDCTDNPDQATCNASWSDICSWNPYDPSCGGGGGGTGSGFFPLDPSLAAGGIGSIGGIGVLIGEGGAVAGCIASLVCGVAVTVTLAVTVAVAITISSHPVAPALPITGSPSPPRGLQPCSPPVGTIGYRLDEVPPAKPHFPFDGDHVHLYQMNQNPLTGQCFWQPIGVTAPPPPPGAVPITPVAGGGRTP